MEKVSSRQDVHRRVAAEPDRQSKTTVAVGAEVDVIVGVRVGVGALDVEVLVGVRVTVGVLVTVGVFVGKGVFVGVAIESEVLSEQLPQPGKVKVRSALNTPASGAPFRLKSASHHTFWPWLSGIFGALAITGDPYESTP